MDSFNDLTTPAALLATRRSGKARDMVAPGPDAAQLAAAPLFLPYTAEWTTNC